MKAIIIQIMNKQGKITSNKIYLRGTQKRIIPIIQRYIYNRVFIKNFFKVIQFKVFVIKDNASQYNFYDSDIVQRWNYTPTYPN